MKKKTKAHPGFKACPQCGEVRPEQFYRKGHLRQSWCKECAKKSIRPWAIKRQAEHKARLNAIKLDSGCVDCGYKAHSEALDFDHLGDKEFGLSYAGTWPWEKVMRELAKCEVVCANCHRIRSANRRQEARCG